MNPHIEIMAIAVVVSVACSLPGTFLVLRRRALISDAISHAVLPGIAIGFLLTGNLNSPLLMIGATLAGLLTAWLTEFIFRMNLVKEDAAIGLVFPVMFSIGVVLITRTAGNVHLDTDAVLLGELAFAPFERLVVKGWDLGPQALWSMLLILAINLVVIIVFFKELKLSTFDPGLAQAQSFRPSLINYGLMTLVSITVVGAFDSVGSILVVALIVAPPASAFLLTRRLEIMLSLSAAIGAISALSGYGLATVLDLSIAGSMAVMCGVCFTAILLFAPGRGLIAQRLKKQAEQLDLGVRMLVVHLSHHNSGNERENERECQREHLTEHINWTSSFAGKVVETARRRAFIEERSSVLFLTRSGLLLAQEAMTQ